MTTAGVARLQAEAAEDDGHVALGGGWLEGKRGMQPELVEAVDSIPEDQSGGLCFTSPETSSGLCVTTAEVASSDQPDSKRPSFQVNFVDVTLTLTAGAESKPSIVTDPARDSHHTSSAVAKFLAARRGVDGELDPMSYENNGKATVPLSRTASQTDVVGKTGSSTSSRKRCYTGGSNSPMQLAYRLRTSGNSFMSDNTANGGKGSSVTSGVSHRSVFSGTWAPIAERQRKMNSKKARMSTRSIMMNDHRSSMEPAAISEAQVIELLAFRGCKELLRGVRLSTVMRSACKIFASSNLDDHSYALSAPVEKLDAFISHNWNVGRYQKLLTLAYYYNMWPAVTLTGLFMVLLACLNITGSAPIIHDVPADTDCTILTRALCTPIFVLGMFLWSDIARLCGLHGPVMFLDRACINQEDQRMQKVGIEKLGAFIAHSDIMLVIFTEEYLQRLWTVYEVASFLAIHRTAEMKILPTFVPVFYLWLIASFWSVQLIVAFLKMFEATEYLGSIVSLMSIIPAITLLRSYCRKQAGLGSQLADFSVTQCKCRDESDRAGVNANIALMMRQVLELSDEEPDEVVLKYFDRLVREEIAAALFSQMSQFVIRHKHILFISILINVPQGIDYLTPTSSVSVTRVVVEMVTWALGATPVLIVLLQRLASRYLQLRGVWEGLYLLFMFATLSAVDVVQKYLFEVGIDAVEDKRPEGFIVLVLLPAAGATLLLINRYVIWRQDQSRGSAPMTSAVKNEVRDETSIISGSLAGNSSKDDLQSADSKEGFAPGAGGLVFWQAAPELDSEEEN